MEKFNNLEDLFHHELKDLYSAEQQILQALPKMAGSAEHRELRQLRHRVPINIEEFLSDPFTATTAQKDNFAVKDLLVQEGDGTIRLFASHNQWHADDECNTLRISSVDLDVRDLLESDGEPARWRTVFDHQRSLYYFDSVLSPGAFWVDMKKVDFSAETGKVMKLDLGPEQSTVYMGEALEHFKPAKPFQFLPAKGPAV